MRRIVSAGFAVAAIAMVAACGANGSSSLPDGDSRAGTAASPAADAALPHRAGSVTIGSAAFPEAELLAYLYAGGMRAHGVKVDVHTNIGERSAYMAALRDGSIGAVPEYSGALLEYLANGTKARTPQSVYTELRAAASKQNLRVADYASAQDTDTITVTGKTANKYHLSSIADLKSVAGELNLGGPAPLRTVPYGIPALKSVYGVEFKRFVSLSPSGSITQTALRNGTVDAADIFSTDPAISRFGFVSLKDPEHIFAAQNIVPVFRNDVLTQPMADGCNAVSSRLDTAELRSLVTKVADGADPSTTAAQWLRENHLTEN
ncbi:ABC transporter substrate-binding protein [Streptomyces sp. Lzd4kr]|nr:ABC transporter substrate-binding protein [Streptomyces sp. Lzd4kr]